MLKIVIFLIVILRLTGNCVKDVWEVESTVVKISNAFADKYSTRCTVLLGPDNPTWEDQRKIFCIAKLLFNNFLYSKSLKIVTFEQFAKEYSSENFFAIYNYHCSKMLSVVYGFNSNAGNQLREVSRNFGPTSAEVGGYDLLARRQLVRNVLSTRNLPKRSHEGSQECFYSHCRKYF